MRLHQKGLTPICCFALLATLQGCAVNRNPASPEVRAAALTPLYCTTGPQCTRYWQRAQLWVTETSQWRIQTATDTVIITYNPTDSSIHRGYKITKEPQADGREQIRISSGCANMFGCSTDEFEMALSFKNYLRAGDPTSTNKPGT